jgi:hypothetical protein
MVFLTILAGHAVLASVDGDAHMSHDELPGGRRLLSTLMGVEHGADRVDREIEPARDLAIGGLEAIAAGSLGIEIGGKLRSIGAKRLHLRSKPVLAVIGLAPAFRRRLERVQRR